MLENVRVRMSGHNRRNLLADHARQDLLEILELSLEVWGPQQMAVYASTIDQALARLVRFPDIGTQAHHLMPGMRRFRVEHHAVFHTYDEQSLTVHRILHERRQVSSDLFRAESDE
jgi:toxin ParE1/3/4